MKLFSKNKDNLLLYIITFSFHIVLIINMKIPYITDEYGTIANAALLSQKFDWSSAYSSSLSSYWGYGMSILYIPIFWMVGDSYDPILLNRLFLFINASVLSFIPLIARKILLLLREQKTCYMNILCFICGIFSSNIVLSKCAWNETMLIFLTWINGFVALLLIHKKHTKKLSAVLAFLLVYNYATHGRGLIISISVFAVVIIASIISKKSYINFFVFLPVFLICFFIHTNLNSYLLRTLIAGTNSPRNTLSQFVSSRNILYLFNFSTIKKLLIGISGLFYYDFIVTMGIISIFILIFFKAVIKCIKKMCEKETISQNILATDFLVLYSGFLFIGSLLLCAYSFSTIYITDMAKRREYFVYGRYTETCLSLILFLALYFFQKVINKRECIIFVGLSAILMFFFTYYFLTPVLSSQGNKTLSYTMAAGIMPFTGINIINNTINYELLIALKVIICLFGIISIAYITNKKYIALLTIGAIYIYSSIFSMNNFLWNSSRSTYENYLELASYFKELDIDGTAKNLYLFNYKDRVLSLQYMLPDYNITYLNKNSEGYRCFKQIARDSFILTYDDELLDIYVKDCYYAGVIGKYHLFFYGNNLINTNVLGEYIKREPALTTDSKNRYFIPGGEISIKINDFSSENIYSLSVNNRNSTLNESMAQNDSLYFSLPLYHSLNDVNIMCNNKNMPKNQYEVFLTSDPFENISEMSKFVSSEMQYSVASADTRDDFIYNGKCLKTQTCIYINGEGSIEIQEIPIGAGTCIIDIEGAHTNLLDYRIYDDKNTLQEIDIHITDNKAYIIWNNQSALQTINLQIIGKRDLEILQCYIEKININYLD